MIRTQWIWGCGVVVLTLWAGCSSGDTERPLRVPATGKVLYQGQPVEGAHVTFAPQDQTTSPAFGTTDAQGTFTLSTFDVEDGAQPGTYAVTISKTVTEGDAAANSAPLNTGTPPPPPKTNDLLPAQYKTATTSGLSATVTEGAGNDFLFELE